MPLFRVEPNNPKASGATPPSPVLKAPPAPVKPSPPPDPTKDPALIAFVDSAVHEVKSAIAEHHFKTESRMVRGLEALDNRNDSRQETSQSALEAEIRKVGDSVESLRQELYETNRSTSYQIEDLSQRLNSTMEGVVEILRQLKSEIRANNYSVDSFKSEARLHSGLSSADEAD